tara:strand:+ start:677 stop:1300 length:624 start_codon:yes stop_codon:yes gene_type:complete
MNKIYKKLAFFMLINIANVNYANNIKNCEINCDAKFGNIIGKNNLTRAYSNCNDKCVSNKSNFLKIKNYKNIYTGMKWQCVEYARRWLIENKGYTFDDVKYAYQIWDLKSAKNIYTNKTKEIKHFTNTKTKTIPKEGDLLIQDNTYSHTGHIAIVTSTHDKYILIAEQNYTNKKWENKSSSRKLSLKKNNKGIYTVSDKTIIGWMRI